MRQTTMMNTTMGVSGLETLERSLRADDDHDQHGHDDHDDGRHDNRR